MGSASEDSQCPAPGKHSDGANRAQRMRRMCPKGKGRAFILGRDTPSSGEIPSERNNSPEKENNRLFSGRAEREPSVIPTAIQAQQTPRKGLGYFAVDVPKRRPQTGKQHKAQEEVYSCPQKSQRDLSSQSFHIPWESTTTHLQVCTAPFGSWNLGPDNSVAKCESKVIALFALGILQIHLA